MSGTLAAVALLVPDYDEAIAFYTRVMRFELLEDRDMGGGKRWVRVAPRAGQGLASGCALLLAKAANDEQRASIGRQGAGRVFLFLHTHDFWDDYRHLQAHGVQFTEVPREEVYGTVVVLVDRYGNKWDLIQPRE